MLIRRHVPGLADEVGLCLLNDLTGPFPGILLDLRGDLLRRERSLFDDLL